MCTTCGCNSGEAHLNGEHLNHDHDHAHTHDHHPHDHGHKHDHGHSHAPGLSQARMVQIEQNILGKNDHFAAHNRADLAVAQVLAINLVSSPGSGKTTLLTRTIQDLKTRFKVAVIEGDQQTSNDAERIRATGVTALQINTGKGCHLDAHMVGHALEQLPLAELDIVYIENVGNLVCPAAFDLGENFRVAILSVTEGEDKPLKYPDLFSSADLLLLNKIDLLPYLTFDVPVCIDYARRINPSLEVIQCSAQSGAGMNQWYQWLERKLQELPQGRS